MEVKLRITYDDPVKHGIWIDLKSISIAFTCVTAPSKQLYFPYAMVRPVLPAIGPSDLIACMDTLQSNKKPLGLTITGIYSVFNLAVSTSM